MACLLGASLGTAGCTSLVAASIPDRYLEGDGGNGWERDLANSDAAPTKSAGGLTQTQALAYKDDSSSRGFQGTLTVTTLRTTPRPAEDKLRDLVLERIQEEADAKGLEVGDETRQGTRTLAGSQESFWFAFEATARQDAFFARAAEVKVFGQVSQCVDEKTVVIVVGLARPPAYLIRRPPRSAV